MQWDRSSLTHLFFRISIALKGMNGIIELISGIVLLFISSDSVTQIVERLFQEELAEDPNSFFANFVVHSSQHSSLPFCRLSDYQGELPFLLPAAVLYSC